MQSLNSFTSANLQAIQALSQGEHVLVKDSASSPAAGAQPFFLAPDGTRVHIVPRQSQPAASGSLSSRLMGMLRNLPHLFTDIRIALTAPNAKTLAMASIRATYRDMETELGTRLPSLKARNPRDAALEFQKNIQAARRPESSTPAAPSREAESPQAVYDRMARQGRLLKLREEFEGRTEDPPPNRLREPTTYKTPRQALQAHVVDALAPALELRLARLTLLPAEDFDPEGSFHPTASGLAEISLDELRDEVIAQLPRHFSNRHQDAASQLRKAVDQVLDRHWPDSDEPSEITI